MPLLDHYRPPLTRTHKWRSFHGAWAAAMARLLKTGVPLPGYFEVMAMLDAAAPSASTGELAAVSYRSLRAGSGGQLQVWPSALAVGQPLPALPLWLNGELEAQLDLEASYTAACEDLRIRPSEGKSHVYRDKILSSNQRSGIASALC